MYYCHQGIARRLGKGITPTPEGGTKMLIGYAMTLYCLIMLDTSEVWLMVIPGCMPLHNIIDKTKSLGHFDFRF